MKHLSQDAIDYMNGVWGFDTCESLDDVNLFWSRGYHELVAKRLVDAGAVEGNCKEAKEMLRVAKSIGPRIEWKLVEAALKEQKYDLVCCLGCNAHHYLGEEYGIDPWEYMKGRCQSCARGPMVTEFGFYTKYDFKEAK
jgi:hypothetical protein